MTLRKDEQYIQSFARIRPFNKKENDECSRSFLDVFNNDIFVSHSHTDKKYTFDKVFDAHSKQCDIYDAVVAPIIHEVLAGYNCTVFAYGQTGSGKTFTMIGEPTSPESSYRDDSPAGIIPRTLDNLFEILAKTEDTQYTVKVSYLELYNEILFDLLAPNDEKLRIYEDQNQKGSVRVHGLVEVTVNDKNEVYEILRKGSVKRTTALTAMNCQSSRSHAVFSITVFAKECLQGEEVLRTGKLHLVDLAGSENIFKSGAINQRAREAGSINQSLLTLGRVIKALVDKSPHIPYRESKLTRILQDSLGGRTITSIIATVSPASSNLDETLNTLDYAFRARNIVNAPEVNQKRSKNQMIQKYLEEIDRFKKDVLAARKKEGIYLSAEKYDLLMRQSEKRKSDLLKSIEECSNFEGQVKELERSKAELEEVYSLHKNELTEATNSLKHTKENLRLLRKERKIHQHLIDKYEESQTILTKHTLILSDALDDYFKDHDILRSKVEKLYNAFEMNEAASKTLLDKYVDKKIVMKSDFEEIMKSLENQCGEIENEMTDMHKANEDLVARLEASKNKLSIYSDSWINGFQNYLAEIRPIINAREKMIDKKESVKQNVTEILNESFANFKCRVGVFHDNTNALEKCLDENYQQTRQQHERARETISLVIEKKFMQNALASKPTLLMEHDVEAIKETHDEEKAICEKYLEELQELLNKNISTYRTKVNERIENMKKPVLTQKETFSKALQEGLKIKNDIFDNITSLEASCTKTENLIDENFYQLNRNIHKCTEHTETKVNEISSSIDDIVCSTKLFDRVIPALNTYAEDSCKEREGIKRNLDDFHNTTSDTLKHTTTNIRQDLLGDVKDQEKLAEDLTCKLTESIHTMKSILKQSENLHNEQSQDIRNMLQDFVNSLVIVKSSGDTPKPRQLKRTFLPKMVSKKVLLKYKGCDESFDEENEVPLQS